MERNELTEAVDRLEELKEEMKELASEALGLLPREGSVKARAEAYWYPHILGALDDQHGYLGGSMSTLQDSVDEMKQLLKTPEGEDEDASPADECDICERTRDNHTEMDHPFNDDGPTCGHSVCSQNYIDNGDASCIAGEPGTEMVGEEPAAYDESDNPSNGWRCPEPDPPPMRTVCCIAGCDTIIVDVPEDERGLSHGYCKPCAKAVREQNQRRFNSRRR